MKSFFKTKQGENLKKRIAKSTKLWQNRLKKEDNEYYKSIKQKAAYESNKSQKKYTKTKPERMFENILKENKIEYLYSFIIGGKHPYQYDFRILNTNLLIEVDGDYWHGNPEIYTKFNHIQKEKKLTDIKKEIFAETSGYTVLRIWESDLTNKPIIKGLINEIQDYSNNIYK